MKTKWIYAAAIVVGSTVVGRIASAQEMPVRDHAQTNENSHRLDPVKNAVELTIGTGYAQGLGDIAANQPTLTDVGTAGGSVQLGVGYRLIPQLTLGVYGSGSAFGRADQVDSSTNIYSATSGVQADWHFLPGHSEWDPWVSLGTGWRGYWLDSNKGNSSLQGWEIGKLQVGVDYRIDKAISVSPVLGADLTAFFTQETPTSNGYANVQNPHVNTFVFAGFQGRFDIPTGSGSSQVASR
jgi:hypothetical protein